MKTESAYRDNLAKTIGRTDFAIMEAEAAGRIGTGIAAALRKRADTLARHVREADHHNELDAVGGDVADFFREVAVACR